MHFQENNDSESTSALVSIIQHLFSKESSKISFILCAEKIVEHDEFLGRILFKINSTISYNIESCGNMTFAEKIIFAVILIDHENADFMLKKIETHQNSFDYYLIHFFGENEWKEVEEKIIQRFSNSFISNLNFVTKRDKGLVLTTFFPFTESSCSSKKSVVINKFTNNSWESSIFFPKKMKNFFKCPLKAVTFIYPPVIMIENSSTNLNYTLYGSDIELFKAIADILNFTIIYDFDSTAGAWGILSDDGEATQGFLKIKSKKADIMLGMLGKSSIRTKYISFTSTIVFNPVMLIIPPGASFSSFEKLFSPFEKAVWLYLLFVFVAGLALVTVLTIQPNNKLKAIIIGKEIRMPSLNMIVAFVGGSQHILPVKSAARMILMTL
jgi:hypothetical protein